VKAAACVVVLALTACERFEQKGPVPTYHDSKLDVMRSVTDQPLPTSHERNAIRAGNDQRSAEVDVVAPASAAASATSARP
jgi:hypothetical protein